jgi:hypothetical protein
MTEEQARSIADVFSGEAWMGEGQQWLAAYWRGDGKYIVFSADSVSEYASEEDFDAAKAVNSLLLASGDEEWWIVMDADGGAIYRHPELKAGWRFREEAEQEARGLQSRTGERFFVKELGRS